MPFIGRESPDHTNDPEMVAPVAPVAPVDADAILAAVLGHLAEPLVRHVADILRLDRMPTVPGSTAVPIAERATDCARAALSDAEFELREQGYRPTRGARLVHQHAARLAVSAVAKVLGADGVSHELTRRVSAALWAQEADRDHWAANSQVRVHRELLDPTPLEPLPTKENP